MMFHLLAQTTPVGESIPTWLGPVSGLGGMGLGLAFLGWYAWHNARYTIPDLASKVNAAHIDAADKATAAHVSAMSAIERARDAYLTESQANRESFSNSIAAVIKHCQEENDKVYDRAMQTRNA